MKYIKSYYKFIGIGVLALFILGFITIIKSNQESSIVGTWVAQGGSFNNRWVFKTNKTVDRYYKNKIYKTYHWEIEKKHSPSGLTIPNLNLTNVKNSDDKRNFIIDTLDKDHMILVAQSDGHISRTTYIRQ